jgi:hypothetical protein
MNKKLKIIIGALALVVIIVLTFFFWRNWQQKQEEKLGYAQFDSFVKQETNGQVWYENKEAGIKFMLPAGWNINPSQLASVALTSSDFQPFSDKPSAASIPSTGCWIGVSVKKEIANTPYDILYTSTKKDIDGNYLVNTETDKYKKFTIDNTLSEAIIKRNPGDRISLKVLRGKDELTLEAILGERQE